MTLYWSTIDTNRKKWDVPHLCCKCQEYSLGNVCEHIMDAYEGADNLPWERPVGLYGLPISMRSLSDPNGKSRSSSPLSRIVATFDVAESLSGRDCADVYFFTYRSIFTEESVPPAWELLGTVVDGDRFIYDQWSLLLEYLEAFKSSCPSATHLQGSNPFVPDAGLSSNSAWEFRAAADNLHPGRYLFEQLCLRMTGICWECAGNAPEIRCL